MIILGTSKGLVLVFKNLGELRGVVKQLSNMADLAETNNCPSPYLYSMSDDRIPTSEIEDMLDKIKIEFKEDMVS